jgi:hypothetical protein
LIFLSSSLSQESAFVSIVLCLVGGLREVFEVWLIGGSGAGGGGGGGGGLDDMIGSSTCGRIFCFGVSCCVSSASKKCSSAKDGVFFRFGISGFLSSVLFDFSPKVGVFFIDGAGGNEMVFLGIFSSLIGDVVAKLLPLSSVILNEPTHDADSVHQNLILLFSH